MQHTLQTDLNHEINALIEEWAGDHPEVTLETIQLALIDSGNDAEARHVSSHDAADERGDWLLEQQRDRQLDEATA
jgi:hypothetical protein